MHWATYSFLISPFMISVMLQQYLCVGYDSASNCTDLSVFLLIFYWRISKNTEVECLGCNTFVWANITFSKKLILQKYWKWERFILILRCAGWRHWYDISTLLSIMHAHRFLNTIIIMWWWPCVPSYYKQYCWIESTVKCIVYTRSDLIHESFIVSVTVEYFSIKLCVYIRVSKKWCYQRSRIIVLIWKWHWGIVIIKWSSKWQRTMSVDLQR